MKRLFSALALAATAALLWQSATPAHACVYPEDYDPIAASDLIVGGRLGAWEVAPDLALPKGFEEHSPSAVAIRVPMSIDAVFKGSAPASIEIIELRAVDLWQGQYSWEFAVSDCGYFTSMSDPPDPGTYVILGLRAGEGGILEEQWAFFSGPSPEGAPHSELLARLADPQSPSRAGDLAAAIAAVAVPVLFLLAASFVFPPRGSH